MRPALPWCCWWSAWTSPGNCWRACGSASRRAGHSVPPERILARYPRTLAHLAKALQRADLALLYDTSGPRNRVVQPPRLVAHCRAGRVLWKNPERCPAWAERLLGDLSDGLPGAAH